jgi:hypothetical protein
VEVLGGAVRHREDSFKEFESSGGERERRPEKAETGVDDEAKISLMSRYYSRYVEDWIKNPLPALGGLSPLESCRTEAGRVKVEELLKDLENHEERKRKEGLPYMDVNKLREKLAKGLEETNRR